MVTGSVIGNDGEFLTGDPVDDAGFARISAAEKADVDALGRRRAV